MFRNSTRKRNLVSALAAVPMFLILLTVNSPAQDEPERQLISHPTPVYSEFAKKLGITGTVKVRVVVAPDGKIKEARVIGGHPVLVDLVRDTLKEWRYVPAITETTTVLEFHFNPKT